MTRYGRAMLRSPLRESNTREKCDPEFSYWQGKGVTKGTRDSPSSRYCSNKLWCTLRLDCWPQLQENEWVGMRGQVKRLHSGLLRGELCKPGRRSVRGTESISPDVKPKSCSWRCCCFALPQKLRSCTVLTGYTLSQLRLWFLWFVRFGLSRNLMSPAAIIAA